MRMFRTALLTTAKTWKAPKCLSATEWMSGLWLCGNTVKCYTAVKTNDLLYVHQYAGILAT